MRYLKKININNVLFLDIETAPKWQHLNEAPENVQKEWIYKFKFKDGAPSKPDPEKNINSDGSYFKDKYLKYFSELWEKSAGLYPEFSRIVCISAGFMYGGTFRLKSYYDANEATLLKIFSSDIERFYEINKYLRLCGHYAKGFDYPFLVKRFLIHRMEIPFILDDGDFKPWEKTNLDTQEIWKIGGFGGSATLSSIAMAFGIPSPKDDIDGSDVSRVYYEGGIDRIVFYCEKDVITLVNVFKSMRREELLSELEIERVVL
jgi:predicted PolB exonuclease-like 3'-5' exonuclease